MKNKKKKKRIIIIILVVLSIVIALYYGQKYYYKNNKNEVKVVDKIGDYGYSLEDRDTSLYKDHYNNLKDILNSKEINYNEYAKEIASLYIIDLYTLSNKVNKYDVGSTEFVYQDTLDNYKLNVENTLYKYLDDNTNKNRNQELPEVSLINVGEVNTSQFSIEETKYDAYAVSVTWDYVKDLGYDKKATITLIKKDNKLYVVEDKNN